MACEDIEPEEETTMDDTLAEALGELARAVGIRGTLVGGHPGVIVETSAELIALELHHIAEAIERVADSLPEEE